MSQKPNRKTKGQTPSTQESQESFPSKPEKKRVSGVRKSSPVEQAGDESLEAVEQIQDPSAANQASSASTDRYHPPFPEAIWDVDPYFKEKILKVGPSRWSCKDCTDNKVIAKWSSGWSENLIGHFGSTHHKNSCTIDTTKLENLVNYYINQKHGNVIGIQNMVDKDAEKLIRFEYTKFFIEEGIPFVKVDSVVKFFKSLLAQFRISDLQKTTLSNVTAMKITKCCIADVIKEAILEDMCRSPYSLAIDSSADFYGDAYLAITVKYIKENEILTKTLSILPIGSSKTGEAMYKQIKEAIFTGPQKAQLERNFLGLCTDGETSMVSMFTSYKKPAQPQDKEKFYQGSGLATRLLNDYRHALVVHDFSHLLNLVAK